MPPIQFDNNLVYRTINIPLLCSGSLFDLRSPAAKTEVIGCPRNDVLSMQATVNPVYYFNISFDPFPGMHFDIPVSSHRAHASNGGHKMIDILLDGFIFLGLGPWVRNNLPQWRLVLERWGFL